ncbi:MAG: SCP2 sterol-binding domain-containing protein [Halobacteriota archaeon]
MDASEMIDQYFEMDEEELKDSLPQLLDTVEGNVQALVEEREDDVPRLLRKLDETDVEEFANDAPEVAERFQDFLWEATAELIERNEELKQNITTSATVNFEADDSPMQGHLEVDADQQTITGGAGSLDDAQLHVTGPSNVLAGMLTGSTDPVQGFMAGEFEMDGEVDKGMELAQVMTPINQKLASLDEE